MFFLGKALFSAKGRTETRNVFISRVITKIERGVVRLRDHRLLNIKAPSGKAGAFFCLIFAITGCGALVSALNVEQEKTIPRIVGGQCEYNKYKGKATIVSVCKKERDKSRGGHSYEKFEVKFSFSPEEEIRESFAKVEGREYTLMLANSWCPGPKFLEKYGIEVGKTFDCYLKVITKGACTPILFDFPTIDLTDYFEKEN